MSKLEKIVGGTLQSNGVILDSKYRPSSFTIKGDKLFDGYRETNLSLDKEHKFRNNYGEEIGLRVDTQHRIVKYGGSSIMAKGKCKECSDCTRSIVGKLVSVPGKIAGKVTVGLFKKKCPVCGHYMSHHSKNVDQRSY